MSDLLKDKASDCLSVIKNLEVDSYIKAIDSIYSNRGGIDGQRSPLKTKTAIRIRSRMVEDLKKGAVLPPIVLGVVVSEKYFENLSNQGDFDFLDFIADKDHGNDQISIIDGMQRTTALNEAVLENPEIANNLVRVEFWISKAIDRLIYRMLVLNTGQVPWDIKRQMETIYQSMLKRVQEEVSDVNIMLLDNQERRTNGGDYRGHKIIELFFAFSSRKINVDVREKVAEDFARVEAVDSLSKQYFMNDFIVAIKYMSNLDKIFSSASVKTNSEEDRFSTGKEIFSSAPAGIGYMAAYAEFVYGFLGQNLSESDVEQKRNNMTHRMDQMVRVLGAHISDSQYNWDYFLDLSQLGERLSAKSGRVGDFERDFFYKAFSRLFSLEEVPESMSVCWAAR